MKNNAPKSGFFSIRILLAGTLCLLAALLGAVSLPAPGGQGGVVLASSNAAPSQIGATSTSMPCPGPAICGQSCSLDPNGVPIYCSNGQCQCAPGYDLQNGVCQPIQPEVIGSENVKHIGGYDCPGICPGAENTTWAFVGSIYNAFDLIPVHGTAPGGEAFMPVWGYQVNNCGDHGVAMGASARAAETTACRAAATVIVRVAPALRFKPGLGALRIHSHSATVSRGPAPTTFISIVVTTVPGSGPAALTSFHATSAVARFTARKVKTNIFRTIP